MEKRIKELNTDTTGNLYTDKVVEMRTPGKEGEDADPYGVYNEDGSLNLNPNSLTILTDSIVEPALMEAKPYESFQFVRQGFFCADYKDSKPGQPVFNRIVSLKSSFKLPKNPA